MKIWFIISLILVLVATALAYATLNPNAEKPDIEKPDFSTATSSKNTQQTGAETNTQETPVKEDVIIEEEHVQYAANELGVYNLHDNPLSKDPAVMEIHLTDTDSYYTITVIDNYPEVEEGRADTKDLTLHMDAATFAEMMEAPDVMIKTKELIEEEKLWAEPFASEKDLALKGYLSLYDSLN